MDFKLPSFQSLFKSEAKSVLGVDIGTSSIKVVQLRREHGRVILETYGAIALGPYAGVEIGRATSLPVEKIAAALKDVIREANVTTADAAISIPYSSSLVSIIKLPKEVEKQLAQVVPIEARKYIPVPINEVLLDWFEVTGGPKGAAVGKDGKIEVLLVAIHNDTIAKFRSIASEASLATAFFEIEVFSAVRASLEHGIAPVAVVDMGAATTKFYVVERGLIHESHIINHGAQDLTLAASRALAVTVAQAEERKRKFGLTQNDDLTRSLELSLAPLLSELSRTIVAYEQRVNQTLGALVLTGGGATLKGLKELAQQKIQNELRLADPFGKTQAPAFLEKILKEAGPEFSVAVGLALRRLQELG